MSEFNDFWTRYPKDLARNKGSRFNAERAWNKLKPEEQERVIPDMEALARYDRQDKDAYRWPMASTFLNQKYWERTLDEPISEVKQRQKLEKCKICSNPVHGVKFDLCQDCIHQFHADRWKHKRKSVLESLKLYSPGMSHQDVIERCKEYGSVNGKFSLAHLWNVAKSRMNSTESAESSQSNMEASYGAQSQKTTSELLEGAE